MQTPAIATQTATWDPTQSFINPANVGKPNALARISHIITEILETLSQISINERRNIDAQRQEMIKLADEQASAKGMQGWISLGSGAIELGAAFIPLAPCFGDRKTAKPLVQIAQKVIGTLNNTGAKFVSTKYEVKELLASTNLNLASKQYDSLVEENRNKANTSAEFKRVAEETREVTKRASSPN